MKGIILAAGYGTRFLPATKTLPKEMLPLIDKPSIAFIVEEFIASGIKDIIVVTNRRKKVMEDYFDREIELETLFTHEGSTTKLAHIKPYDVNICFVRQTYMNGSGHGLLAAKPWIGDEPVVVAYPDDVHFGEEPLARQLIKAYEQSGCCQLATLACAPEEVSRYGILQFATDSTKVEAIVEKPSVQEAPSTQASIGRYLYTPQFFALLQEEANKFTGKGEFYHTHGLNRVMALGQVESVAFSGTRVDTGEPAGYFEAIITYAQAHPEYSKLLKAYLK